MAIKRTKKMGEDTNREYGVPKGYTPGLGRDYPHPKRSHLYKGDFGDPGLPMCKWGWNRDDGESYSIWRNNIGDKGICKICMRRAKQGKDGVESNYDYSIVEEGVEFPTDEQVQQILDEAAESKLGIVTEKTNDT